MKHLKITCFTFSLLLISCTDILIGDEGKLDEDIFLNYQTKTDLALPFEGEWGVSVAGTNHIDGGHHFITRGTGQRYAYDMYKVVDGKALKGDDSRNEDSFTFGARLNAPGDGVVIAIENNINDNARPGSINSDINDNNLAGNYIIIDHLNGEYSLLAHLKKGTIIVSVGDTVVKGQELGQAGNSGNSAGPHLHYHLQNSPRYLDGLGLPAQFQNYHVKNEFVERGMPSRNQIVRKAEEN